LLKTIGIQDLEAYTGLPRRTIHFYVKEGLIPPPEGAGRGAHYEWHHVHALKLISALKAGTHLRLEGIREILQDMPPEIMAQWVYRIENGKRTAGELAARYAIKELPPPSDAAGPVAGADMASGPGEEKRNLMYSIDPPPPALKEHEGADAETDESFDHVDEGALLDEQRFLQEEQHLAQRAVLDELEGRDTPATPSDSPEDDASLLIGGSRKRSLFGRLLRKQSSSDAVVPDDDKPETWKRIRLADDVEIQIRDDVSDERRRQIEAIIQMTKEMFDS
jgi:DNA-binding transcriptional MerR regulator